MDNNESFKHMLFSAQMPAAVEYFDARAPSCFSPHTGQLQATFCSANLWHNLLSSRVSSEPREGKAHGKVIARSNGDQIIPILTLQEVFSVQDLPQSLDNTDGLIIFLSQRSSRSQLNCSNEFLKAVMKLYNLSDQLMDFVICFGLRNGEMELSPPPPQFRWQFQTSPSSPVGFECTYILRYVELNKRREQNPWSLRQCLVFHRFSPSSQPEIFIFIGMPGITHHLVNAQLAVTQYSSNSNPFHLHLILLNLTAATWRSYLVYIAGEVRKLADQTIVADLNDGAAGLATLEDRQYLKQLEDMVADIINAIESSIELCSIIRSKNADYRRRYTASSIQQVTEGQEAVLDEGLHEKERQLTHYRVQASQIYTKLRSTESLITNVLDLKNGNALKLLAIEAGNEGEAMKELTRNGIRDAAAVKVLTVVTLVYLPGTAVLNFFSTSFVSSTGPQDGPRKLIVAENWWVAIIVTIPLTVLTLYVWWFYVQTVVYARPPRWWQIVSTALRPSCLRKHRGMSRRANLDAELTDL